MAYHGLNYKTIKDKIKIFHYSVWSMTLKTPKHLSFCILLSKEQLKTGMKFHDLTPRQVFFKNVFEYCITVYSLTIKPELEIFVYEGTM